MTAAIRVEGLGKRYSLRQADQNRYGALRDDLAALATAPIRALRNKLLRRSTLAVPKADDFWAVRDVSFEVQPGEVVGIVGNNGAGKSTLLKLLSRITEPTAGSIELTGRVASLLEVGTGFHPELTGRENIYLNGAILGMRRAEIRSKFDEIVEFAEVSRFLDTPVKRYSSGMYVRLAFAVAAHLEPEILVVDEVLAVGDAQFQKKCLGKIRDVSNVSGRTVLFVSHQMGTVRQLCSRAILMQAGQLVDSGPTNEVITRYMTSGMNSVGAYTATNARAKDVCVASARTLDSMGAAKAYFLHDEPIQFEVVCAANRWVPNTEIRLIIEDDRGRRVFTSDAVLGAIKDPGHALVAHAALPPLFLRPATYFVSLYTFVHNQLMIDSVPNALSFVVQDGGSKYAASEGVDYGCVFGPCTWTVRAVNEATVRSAAD